jgi:uncharacterized membrane protein
VQQPCSSEDKGVEVIAGIVAIVLAVAVMAVGVLGWVGRLPRNPFVGVRTWSTMQSSRAFEIGNRVAGPATTLGGLVAIAAGVITFFAPDDAGGLLAAGVAVMASGAVFGGILGDRAANRESR